MKNSSSRDFGIAAAMAVTILCLVPANAPAADPPSTADDALFDRLDANRNGQIEAAEVSTENSRLFARLLRRADINDDNLLSRAEFIAGLVPTRPEKPLEEKQPATFPQADAVRFVLLSMDTNGDGRIEENEVPDDLKPLFDSIAQRIDRDENRVLDRRELNQGGPPLAQIAGRYARDENIDASAELAKLEQQQGAAASRFDGAPPRWDNLGDPAAARQLFAQLDTNGDGRIEKKEVSEPFTRPFERLLRAADRNNDGRLSEREFLSGARQVARRQSRPEAPPRPRNRSNPPQAMPAEKEATADESSMSAEGK